MSVGVKELIPLKIFISIKLFVSNIFKRLELQLQVHGVQKVLCLVVYSLVGNLRLKFIWSSFLDLVSLFLFNVEFAYKSYLV